MRARSNQVLRIGPGLAVVMVGVLGALVVIITLAAIDGEAPAWLVAGETLRTLAWPVVLPLIYLLSAWGLGTLVDPWLGSARERNAIRFACGLAGLVSISHLLGVLGLLGAPYPILVLVPGLVLAGLAGWRGARSAPPGQRPRSWWSLALVVPIAVLMLAAASPPGWLWDSEFGGFDALSYHIELPREWIARGRVWPVEHNVYSYLPSYLESAFTHIAQLVPVRHELWVQGGWRLISMQALHALLAIAAALLVRRAVVRIASPDGSPSRSVDAIGWLSAALVLATPWTAVVGSLAYNEMGVAVLLAGALIVACEAGITPGLRAMIVGGLVGVACGIKPTALLFAGMPAGIMLLLCAPRSAWGRMIALGSAVGLIALAPWLVRNTIASGNPVFPLMTDLFGAGHWTSDQARRFHDAHFFQGSLIERLGLIVWPVGDASRGMTHRQWMLLFPAVAVAMGLALVQRRSSQHNKAQRTITAALSLGLVAQLLAWLFTTHLQSRFLLPMIVPGAILVGAVASGGCRVSARGDGQHARGSPWRVPAAAVLIAVVGVQIGTLGAVYLDQHDGHPSLGVVLGVSTFSGQGLADDLASLAPDQRAGVLDQLPPEPWINLVIPADAPVLLVGGSTPLYLREPIVYHTTWDAAPLGALMRAHPDEPGAWTRGLADAGIRFVLINFAEVQRLTADGWYDPLVTPDAVRAWISPTGPSDPAPRPVLVRDWPELGVGLFELPRE